MTTTTIFHDLVRRLQSNVDAGLPDMTDAPMKVPAVQLQRPGPLPPGDRPDLPEGAAARRAVVRRPRAGRVPVVRGGRPADHRRARRRRPRPHVPQRLPPPWGPRHRRALRQHPPLHLPVPLLELRHRRARSSGVPGRDSFGEIDATGLIELPTEERVGAVFACLDPDADLDLDSWLGGLDESLAALRLDELYPYKVPTYAGQPELEAGRRRLPRRVPHRLPAPEHDRPQGDHEPQHLRHVRAPRPDRLRHQADGRGRRRRPSTKRQPARLLEPRALRVPERVDLRRPRRHADAQQAAARPYRRPLDHRAVPVLPPADRRRHGGSRRGEAADLRVGRPRRGLRHDLRHQRQRSARSATATSCSAATSRPTSTCTTRSPRWCIERAHGSAWPPLRFGRASLRIGAGASLGACVCRLRNSGGLTARCGRSQPADCQRPIKLPSLSRK